jgi:hypothetical protein
MLTVRVPPAEGKLRPLGVAVYPHGAGGTPSCVITNDLPAIIMVALRREPVFASTVTVTIPAPMLYAKPAALTHEYEFFSSQAHAVPVPTLTLYVPPCSGTASTSTDIVYVPGWNCACNVYGLSTVNIVWAVVPTRKPIQEEKHWPGCGVALMFTLLLAG